MTCGVSTCHQYLLQVGIGAFVRLFVFDKADGGKAFMSKDDTVEIPQIIDLLQ